MKTKKSILNKKGQGLIEYLIIVAIVAVGSMAVVRVVGANLSVKFGAVANALGGVSGKNQSAHEVTNNMTKKRDFSDFFEGSVSPSKSEKK